MAGGVLPHLLWGDGGKQVRGGHVREDGPSARGLCRQREQHSEERAPQSAVPKASGHSCLRDSAAPFPLVNSLSLP